LICGGEMLSYRVRLVLLGGFADETVFRDFDTFILK